MPYSDTTLSGDVLYEYNERPLRGLANCRMWLINYNDIDWSTYARVDTAEVGVPSLEAGGKEAFKVEFYKELATVSSAYAPSTETVDGFTNSVIGRLGNTTTDNATRANELKDGRFVAIVETKFRGADAIGVTPADYTHAFKILGYDSGMELSEMTYNANENDGTILFTLASPEGMNEKFPYRVVLDTDYDTTLTAIEALETPTV